MLLTVALAASLACAVPAGQISRQVVLSYGEFDSYDGPHGWRSLGNALRDDHLTSLRREIIGAGQFILAKPASRHDFIQAFGRARDNPVVH